MPEFLEVARITIVKTLDDDGEVIITTTISDGRLALSDALGMLAFAQAMTVRDYLGDDE